MHVANYMSQAVTAAQQNQVSGLESIHQFVALVDRQFGSKVKKTFKTDDETALGKNLHAKPIFSAAIDLEGVD